MFSYKQVFLCLAAVILNLNYHSTIDWQHFIVTIRSQIIISTNTPSIHHFPTFVAPITIPSTLPQIMVSQVNKPTTQPKAAKSTATATKAKTDNLVRRQSKRFLPQANLTEVLQGINKPNVTRAEVVLESLGRPSNATPAQTNNQHNNPAEVSPVSNNGDSPSTNGNATQANPSPPATNEEAESMEVEETTPATATGANANQPPSAASNNNPPPAANSNNPSTVNTGNNHNSNQPPKQPNVPATPSGPRRSSLRADTPRFAVPKFCRRNTGKCGGGDC